MQTAILPTPGVPTISDGRTCSKVLRRFEDQRWVKSEGHSVYSTGLDSQYLGATAVLGHKLFTVQQVSSLVCHCRWPRQIVFLTVCELLITCPIFKLL